MKKINLKSADIPTAKKRGKGGNTSLVIGALLLLISLGAYGAVFYLIKSTDQAIIATEHDINTTKKKMDTEDTRTLYDFQGRLLEMESFLAKKIKQSEALNKISVYTLAQTQFISLSDEVQEGNVTKVEAVILTPDHYALSQQLESYSFIKGIDNVILETSKQEEVGVESKISFYIK